MKIISTLYVSNKNTVQVFNSLFHSPPQTNNKVCSPCIFIHVLRQVKLVRKRSELLWEGYLDSLLNCSLPINEFFQEYLTLHLHHIS